MSSLDSAHEPRTTNKKVRTFLGWLSTAIGWYYLKCCLFRNGFLIRDSNIIAEVSFKEYFIRAGSMKRIKLGVLAGIEVLVVLAKSVYKIINKQVIRVAKILHYCTPYVHGDYNNRPWIFSFVVLHWIRFQKTLFERFYVSRLMDKLNLLSLTKVRSLEMN